MTAFFSRRIGLDRNARPQKIDYGAKLVGTIKRFDIGLLQVRTGNDRGVLAEDFTVFRPKRKILAESYVGLMYTRRATPESTIPDRHTIGGDMLLATSRFLGSKNLNLSAYYIKTPNGVPGDNNGAWGGRLVYPNDVWSSRTILKTLGTNFDPAVGFRNPDYREFLHRTKFAPRPRNNRWIRQFGAEFYTDLYMNKTGVWTQRDFNYIFDITFQSSDTASFTITRIFEHLDSPFSISPRLRVPEGANITTPGTGLP